jgi:hypothetical protein
MLTKFMLAICNFWFEVYGWLYRYGVSKNVGEDFTKHCIDQREELLDHMSTLKGLK